MNGNNEKAMYGESYVYQKMLDAGLKVKWVAFGNRSSKADFVTDKGLTIDVKYSSVPHATYIKKSGKKSKYWRFNAQHHGIKQSGIDFYVCVLQDGGEPDMFIFPAENIDGYQIYISDRHLRMGTYEYFRNNWELISEAEKTHSLPVE